MAEALEDAVEAKDKRVALIIAILALFLALSEAGGKNAEHRSTEKNIESSDLYNFYQAKKIRAEHDRDRHRPDGGQPAGRRRSESPGGDGKADRRLEGHDHALRDRKAKDGTEAIQERAKEAAEGRELSNHRLEHYEYASGLIQIAIVLASAAIITGIGTADVAEHRPWRDRRGSDGVRLFRADRAWLSRLTNSCPSEARSALIKDARFAQ